MAGTKSNWEDDLGAGSNRFWIAWVQGAAADVSLYVAGLIGPGDRRVFSVWQNGLHRATMISCIISLAASGMPCPWRRNCSSSGPARRW